MITVGNNNCLPITYHFLQHCFGTPKGFIWDFGNGKKSNKANPFNTYTNPGSYTIKLIAVYNDSISLLERTINVLPNADASFIVDISNLCQPDTVHFSVANFNQNVLYEWNFGDSSQSIVSQQNHVDHYFEQYGTYYVQLKAVGENGCQTTKRKKISVVKPTLDIITSSRNGCVPKKINFRAIVNDDYPPAITNYSWNYGDGTIVSTDSPITNHTFVQNGAYFPLLTISTNNGCTITYPIDSLNFGIPPINIHSINNPTECCASEVQHFNSMAQFANEYKWNFGDEVIYTTDTTIDYKFKSLGIKKIKITPINNGCPGQMDTLTIKVKGVISKWGFHNNCNDYKQFNFTNRSLGNISNAFWSFGDDSSSNLILNVRHSYSNEGIYHVMLRIEDSITGCRDSITKTIFISKPSLSNDDDSICIHTNSNFRITNLIAPPNTFFKWELLGNHPVIDRNSVKNIVAKNLGNFINSVVLLKGNSYCNDTLFLDHSIIVKGPKVDFEIPADLCRNQKLKPLNNSIPFFNYDTITHWIWNFGSNTMQSNLAQPDSFLFDDEGLYKIRLKAIDKWGCTDSIYKNIRINEVPFIWNIPHHKKICQGEELNMNAYSSDSINWYYGNQMICRNCSSVTIRPNDYNVVSTIAKNEFGCSNNDSVVIDVYKAFQSTISSNDTSICLHDTVLLSVIPIGKKVLWTPDDFITGNTGYQVKIFPDQTSKYYVHMSDSMNCFTSTDSVFIRLKEKVWVDAGRDIILPYQSTFTFIPSYSNNVAQVNWTPSAGLSCSDCSNPIGVINESKNYHIAVTSDSGCLAKDSVYVFIACEGTKINMPTAFTPNHDGINDLYRPTFHGIRLLKQFAIYNKMGQLVYEVKNQPGNYSKVGWDGYFKQKEQNAGTYIYIIEAICDSGLTISSKGSFILLR